MKVAIYDFFNTDTECPSCNQAGAKMALSEIGKCKDKVKELYGEGHVFREYIDRKDVAVTSSYLSGATVRPAIERLLEDIDKGEIDLVVMTYMGVLAADFYFILAFYLFLRQHDVRIITVREGERINQMLEQAIEEFRRIQNL